MNVYEINTDVVPATAVQDRELAHFLAIEDETAREVKNFLRRRANEDATARREAEFKLERFRQLVRETAIEVADEMNWCRPGLNEVLEKLGLDKHNRKYRVTVEVVVDVENEGVDDESDARCFARDFVRDQVGDDDGYKIYEVDWTNVDELDD